MASPLRFASSFLLIAAVALLISPAATQTCKSQNFTRGNTNFANCTDLPTLKAHLHWTYDASSKPDPTLDFAFIAPPAKPEGWVAWALNPTGKGMVGAQALVAFKDTNGSVVVKTYNISAYGPITESRISYPVLRKRAEFSGGVMRIFAKLGLPARDAVENQVWQVGASVMNGVPVKHDVSPENLNSKDALQLVSTATEGNKGEPPSLAPAPAPTLTPGGSENGGSSMAWGSSLGLHGALALIAVVLGFEMVGF